VQNCWKYTSFFGIKVALFFLLQRLLGVQMATFRLYLVCRWSSDDFEVYKEGLAQLTAGEADDSS
jgi:hypothetical protein